MPQIYSHASGKLFWVQKPVLQFKRLSILEMHDDRVEQRLQGGAAKEFRLRAVRLDNSTFDHVSFMNSASSLDLLDHVAM